MNIVYGVAGSGLTSAGAQQFEQSEVAGRNEAVDQFGSVLSGPFGSP